MCNKSYKVQKTYSCLEDNCIYCSPVQNCLDCPHVGQIPAGDFLTSEFLDILWILSIHLDHAYYTYVINKCKKNNQVSLTLLDVLLVGIHFLLDFLFFYLLLLHGRIFNCRSF